MFSTLQKRVIAEVVQKLLRSTNHRELPDEGEIKFTLRVEGAAPWSWAVIRNNGDVSVEQEGL